MLVVSNLQKKYKNVEALNFVSFVVKPGETTILLGPNGAGKSTTIKAISGLLKFNGDITLDGLKNTSLEARKMFSYIGEIPYTFPYLTIREHVEFMINAYNVTDGKARMEHFLEAFELVDKQDKLGKELSKGMQQKLNIVCGLVVKPKYILFDEPLIGLDPKAIRECKKIFQQLKEENTGILISTHIIDTLADVWDNVIILQNGYIKLKKDRAEFEAEYLGQSLEDVFFKLTLDGEAIAQ